ncbi:MAG: galactose mutarotase [Clostridia bacterium]|nr:galactose mutarotase [Clostridia bacterium]
MSIQKQYFGKMPDGRAVTRYILQNENGMTAAILDWAGAIQELRVPDRKGGFVDVVGGFESASQYYYGNGHQGSLIGRFGNRIKDGVFTLDGVTYTLAKNNGANHLHGGVEGYSRQFWEVTPVDGEEPALRLHYFSPDGDQGYPGALDVTVTYTLTNENALSIRYVATTDKATIVNMTNHAYFNLGGFASGTVLDHELWMDADTYLPTDEGKVPTGEIRSVSGTPFDFTVPKTVGRDYDFSNEDIRISGGYDHCFNFVGGETKDPVHRATLYSPKTGIEMKTFTNKPAVHLYSAGAMNNVDCPLKGGYPQNRHCFVCLETEKMPDSINQPHFNNVVLRPGEVYDYTTVYAFGIAEGSRTRAPDGGTF